MVAIWHQYIIPLFSQTLTLTIVPKLQRFDALATPSQPLSITTSGSRFQLYIQVLHNHCFTETVSGKWGNLYHKVFVQLSSAVCMKVCQQKVVMLTVTRCGHRECIVQMELKSTVTKTCTSFHFCHLLTNNT